MPIDNNELRILLTEMKNIVSRIKRGSLIRHSLEGIKRGSFGVIKKELKGVLKDKMGITLYMMETNS